MPLGTIVGSDLALNLYYYFALHINSFQPYQFVNYAAFAGIIWFGTRFNHRSRFLYLLSGGIVGALMFYLLTNTAAWLFNPFHNPEYTKDLAGWIIALTKGTGGYPSTIQFFLNTLFSGGLFTGLFTGAMKIVEASESLKEKEAGATPVKDSEGEPASEEA